MPPASPQSPLAEPPSAPLADWTIVPLDPSQDAAVATILSCCLGDGTAEAGRVLATARLDPDVAIYGLLVGEELVAVFAVRKAGLTVELVLLTVAERWRRHGYGRACVHSVLRQAGKRPLVVEADDESLGFCTALGFKLVGKRRQRDGTLRYRLGWHAPRPAALRSLLGGSIHHR